MSPNFELHILAREFRCIYGIRDLHEVFSQYLEPIQSGLGASWICSTAPQGQASTPEHPCEGHYFPEVIAGPSPSYTALSAWFDRAV